MTTADVQRQLAQGLTAYQIAALFNKTPSAVYYHMNKVGAPRRKIKFDPEKHPDIGRISHGASIRDDDGKRWPEYEAYIGAKGRCSNSNDKSYINYGGRGIEFRYENFEQFITDVGRRPHSRHTLERKNNNGHYELGNCKWATMSEQLKNRRKGLRKRLFQFSDEALIAECERRGMEFKRIRP